MLTLDRTLAQSIVDRAMTIIDGNVNVMDHSGVIIASGEPARIGQLHEGALLVLSRQGRVEIDAALAQQLDAVRPGVNLPLIADGRIVGCVGLTGDPQRIGQQAELVRMAAEAMLEQAGLLRLLARDARLREEVTLGLIRPDGPTPALAGWAERLGIALELPRVAAVIEVESDSLDLDAMLVELQRLHTLLSTPERGNLIAATALNELVVLKPALDRRGHWDVEEQRRRAHSLLERMRASSRLRIRLALGQYFPQANGLALSHQIARTTMRIGKARTPHADAFFYDDYRLPVLVDDLRQAWQADELRKPLQALLAQDRRSQLLKTLSVWFGAGMRMAPPPRRWAFIATPWITACSASRNCARWTWATPTTACACTWRCRCATTAPQPPRTPTRTPPTERGHARRNAAVCGGARNAALAGMRSPLDCADCPAASAPLNQCDTVVSSAFIEAQRLARLALLQVVDTAAEPFFDALAAAAQAIAGTPIALVSLVDERRQWWKANIGLPGVSETPRELAFCAYTIQGDAVMEVRDAPADPRFHDNALVTDAPGIRYYAGAPIVLPDGLRMGTVCVIDQRARAWSRRNCRPCSNWPRWPPKAWSNAA